MTKQTCVFQSFLWFLCYLLFFTRNLPRKLFLWRKPHATVWSTQSCDSAPWFILSTWNSRRKSVLRHNRFFNVWIVVLLVETVKYIVIHWSFFPFAFPQTDVTPVLPPCLLSQLSFVLFWVQFHHDTRGLFPPAQRASHSQSTPSLQCDTLIRQDKYKTWHETERPVNHWCNPASLNGHARPVISLVRSDATLWEQEN